MTMLPFGSNNSTGAAMSPAMRRKRQRDSAAVARKSRQSAFKRRLQENEIAYNVLGIARVYFNDTGTPAMQANVRAHVDSLVAKLQAAEDLDTETARTRVEETMRSVLVAADGPR